jgi:hypothetical protein
VLYFAHVCEQPSNSSNSQFTFSLRPTNTQPPVPNPGPITSASHSQHTPIDPALIPVPDGDDSDLQDGPSIARARGYTPADTIAGSRQKTKQRISSQKRKQLPDFDEDLRTTKCGRPQGAGNYLQEDLKALLDAVQEELPLGQRGWQNIHAKYSRWARKRGHPERARKSLETKYKQVH